MKACAATAKKTEGGTTTHQWEYERDDDGDVYECWYCGIQARLPYGNEVPFEEIWEYILPVGAR